LGAIFTSGNCCCPDPGEYGLLLCRVVLGDVHLALKYESSVYKGDSRYPVRRPPAKTDATLGELYDSILGESKEYGGDSLQYREFIVYDRHQVYPEYVIHFKRKAPPK